VYVQKQQQRGLLDAGRLRADQQRVTTQPRIYDELLAGPLRDRRDDAFEGHRAGKGGRRFVFGAFDLVLADGAAAIVSSATATTTLMRIRVLILSAPLFVCGVRLRPPAPARGSPGIGLRPDNPCLFDLIDGRAYLTPSI
jgi:hypothetical protein